MPWLKEFIVAAAIVVPVAARAQDPACHDPFKPMLRAELLFGRNIGNRSTVSDTLWRQFVVRELTPRFPEGLTVIDAQGQWRDPRGAVVREPSKIVMIVTADNTVQRERIAAAAEAYKRRFKQLSVGVLMRPVCAAF